MLIVASQATITTEPTEGPFHHPTPRQDLKAFHIIRTFYDFQDPAKLLANRLDDRSVGTVGPDQLQAAPTIVNTAFDRLEQSL